MQEKGDVCFVFVGQGIKFRLRVRLIERVKKLEDEKLVGGWKSKRIEKI